MSRRGIDRGAPTPMYPRRESRALHQPGSAERGTSDDGRPHVVFLVNGPVNGPIGERARSFAERLDDRYQIVVAYRASGRVRSIVEFVTLLKREHPQLCYVFDMAYSGIIAGLIAKMAWGIKLAVDTGDAAYELARSAGLRGPLGLGLTWLMERIALRMADHVVVRGTFHRELLAGRGIDATVIQDGIDTKTFSAGQAGDVRARLGLDGVLSVGFLGSLVWSQRLQMGYGWDLVEAIRILRDEPVKGILIGAGTARPILEARAREYGLGDRMLFLDPVPYAEVPRYLAAIDVWLSTQTNDIPGNVRTTGKLPLYLAAGRYVLATDVGEAALVLPPEMRIEYRGTVDQEYPARLADRLRGLIRHRERLAAGAKNIETARTIFDYDVLSRRFGDVLASLTTTGAR
jgi:glycosyltransferase involved in cell wall biosynthesis